MPDSSEFEDVVEFKKILLDKQFLFNRAITEKMLPMPDAVSKL